MGADERAQAPEPPAQAGHRSCLTLIATAIIGGYMAACAYHFVRFLLRRHRGRSY